MSTWLQCCVGKTCCSGQLGTSYSKITKVQLRGSTVGGPYLPTRYEGTYAIAPSCELSRVAGGRQLVVVVLVEPRIVIIRGFTGLVGDFGGSLHYL